MTQELIAALAGLARQRQTELDQQIAGWRLGPGAGIHLWCGPGCGSCCALAVNATLPEALAIANLIDKGDRQKLTATATRIVAHARESSAARNFLSGYRQAVGPCPFLDASSNCLIYATRPLACRALLSTRPPDWCGVNLAKLPELERESFLGSLDRSTVAYPTHYAAEPRSLAGDLEDGLLNTMLRSAGLALAGSLPLLVWLCGEEGFFAALTGGPNRLRAFLAARDADRPFLVQIDTP